LRKYLWRVEFKLKNEGGIWSAKDFVASPEFDDAYNVSKEFLKSERGTGKNLLDLVITKLERGMEVDSLDKED